MYVGFNFNQHMTSVKKISLGIALLIPITGFGAFAHLTRPIAEPSQSGQAVIDAMVGEDQNAAGGTVITDRFELVSAESQARFEIDEILNDQPVRVVGVTSDVTGSIVLIPGALAESSVTPIVVNARTLKTDNERRNGALGRMILKSEDPANEFITFVPTALNDLPASLAVGETISFKVTGNLTVSGTTKEVTFDATATYESADRVTGSASTVVNYKDFGLVVPNLPFLAWVDENVTLAVDLVATR